jgi:membrane protein YqaA with SNARE-associated domain
LLCFLHLGYLAPFVIGVLDSSFLVLPFGNDLLVVLLVSRRQQGLLFYILAAACGSIVGAFILALVAGRIGEEGIRKLAGGKRRFHQLAGDSSSGCCGAERGDPGATDGAGDHARYVNILY